jgi:hypothetical protein
LSYLQNAEWSMGNGQCPCCFGVSEKWLGHPLYLTPETLGHKPVCELAKDLKSLGHTPLYLGQSKLTDTYESYITPGGFYSTRKLNETTIL